MGLQMNKPISGLCLRLLGGLAPALLLVGCATIIHGGTRQNVPVASSPPGARVIVKGAHMATTPAVIELSRKESYVIVRFEKEGYEPAEVVLNRKVSPWIASNLIWGPGVLIGLAIDFIGGGAYTLSPSEARAVMTDLEERGVSLEDMSNDGVIVPVDSREPRNSGR